MKRTLISLIEQAVVYAILVFGFIGGAAARGDDGDPTGFVRELNAVRLQYGLRPVSHYAPAAVIAIENNRYQNARGTACHAVLGGFGQCAGFGQRDVQGFLASCLGSPAHRTIILSPGLTFVGYAGSGLAHTVSTWCGAIAPVAPAAPAKSTPVPVAPKKCPTCAN